MKRVIALLLAICMLGTTAYATETNTDSLKHPSYMSISRFGKIAYFSDKESVSKYIDDFNTYLEEKGLESGEKYNYKGDFYRIIIHSKTDKENVLSPYIKNALKTFTIYSKPVVDITFEDNTTQEIWLDDEDHQLLIQKIRELFDGQLKYDRYLDFDIDNPQKLGIILNNQLFYLSNAFIDHNGKTWISLSDWNQVFLGQYGNTKQLSFQSNMLLLGQEKIKIEPTLKNGIVYLPLRNVVDYFSIFSVQWDSNLKKVVIYEKWHNFPNES